MDILITGNAGYIGKLVTEKYLADPDIKSIYSIDLLPVPESLRNNPKLHWIQADLAVPGWEEKIPSDIALDAVIHCAFKIRNPYGKKRAVEENNTAACRNVFSFAFDRNVPTLIYLSSVATYGAKPANIGRLLTEEEPLDEIENAYGYQKALSERILNELLAQKNPSTRVFVLRLNSVTGPRGQGLESKFGLITFLKKLLPFVIETNPYWARQFVHEEDVAQIIYLLATQLTTRRAPNDGKNPEVFNIAPEKFLTARDMAKLLDKKVLHIPAWTVQPLFWIAWNISFGRIPTRPDSYKGLIYPINVDGSHIKKIGFDYAHTAEEALMAKK
ncbi:MAG TPA: NAD-dependent epimerase/dehydratase family protein [Candidatus Paceibacterota bacterium]|nr:NAD-dependent epimerase/dehydratase family protein [Candidatus Paceibacterota bacterium]